MDVSIYIQRLEDNNYEQSSRLRIKDGKMCQSIHDFGESTPNGDEIEIWHNFDEENTQMFLDSLGLTGKSDVEIQKTLEEKFSQRPTPGVFDEFASANFDRYVKELGLTYKFGSW